MSFEFLTEDWKKIPITTKYFFSLGTFFLVITWLVDHWGTNNLYRLLGWDFRNTFFTTGVFIIFLTFIPLVWNQSVYWSNSFKYKEKYPIKDFNIKFFLGWFKGRQYLFDPKEKKYFHIHPYETSRDLAFNDLGVVYDNDIKNLPEKLELSPGNVINTNEYADGGMINSRAR